MPIIRKADCVPLPIVVCPVVAVVMLEIRVARCVHCTTGGNNYIVRKFKIIFWDLGIHVFPNDGGQKHLVRDIKGQRCSQGKDGYRE